MARSFALVKTSPRLQFTLRALLGWTAALSVFLGLTNVVSWKAGLMVAWFGCMILFHVAGNAIGTKRRDRTSQTLAEAGPPPQVARRYTPPPVAATQLGGKLPLSGMMAWFSGIGFAVGATLGGLALAGWVDVNASGLIVGTLSSGIVGGFIGFLASSFLAVAAGAVHEAASNPLPAAGGEDA